MRLRVVILVLIAASFAGSVRAQERPIRRDIVDGLSVAARARVLSSDTTLAFRTRTVPGGRMDLDAGVLRAAYRVRTRVAPAGSPEATARAYLQQAARQFGWPGDARDLQLHSVITGAYSSHITFQQAYQGVPVYNRYVAVNLNAVHQPTMVLSGYAPHLSSVRGFSTHPAISAEAARDQATRAMSQGSVRTTTPELVVYPSDQPRLAWRMIAWPQDVAAEWEILVDAHTGTLIQLINQTTHVHEEGGNGRGGERERGGEKERGKEGKGEREKGKSLSWIGANSGVAQHGFDLNRDLELYPRSPTPIVSSPFSPSLPLSPPLLSPLATSATGSGLVFDPDPITSAGAAYGIPYADQNDADTPELTAQLREVALRDLTLRDGRYYLEGPYVTIVGDAFVSGGAYVPPSEADPNAFRYTRSDDRFEAVMAYYHIDQSQRYVQSLEVGRPIHALPIRVNPHGFGERDESQFFPALDVIVFGQGGIDDAEDAQVILHEYAHALLQSSAPGHITGGGEGLALHEGWADYWAASYVRGMMERGELRAGDWRRLFRWDGNNPPWCGRALTHTGHYPDQMAWDPLPECSVSAAYQRGLLWATTMMEVYTVLGRAVTDRLNLASHAYLGAPPITMRDAAEAILQADVDLYGGPHLSALTAILTERGFLGGSAPRIVHTPVQAVERVGGSLVIDVGLDPESAPIDSMYAYYRAGEDPYVRVRLERNDDLYQGRLILPDQPADVTYYLEAVATSGERTRLPHGAPSTTYTIRVGPGKLELYPNSPDPFEGTTNVLFRLPEAGHVTLELYDVMGRRVLVLEDGEREAGTHTIRLDGSRLAGGTYFLRMRAGGEQTVEPVRVVR